jgi:DNA/RNA-binding domain of Phe-tRNA-synthetase-like protein
LDANIPAIGGGTDVPIAAVNAKASNPKLRVFLLEMTEKFEQLRLTLGRHQNSMNPIS